MTRLAFAKSTAMLCLLASLAACGQAERAVPSSDPAAAADFRPPHWPYPPPHHPLPHPPPSVTWTCQIMGKDGDVFGNFTGKGGTQAAAEANGLSQCQAVRDYASCWVEGCSET